MTSGPANGTCITIGNFDGVHLGHQALIGLAQQVAHSGQLDFELITFWPHPRLVLKSGGHQALTSRSERMRLLSGLGIGKISELSFTPEFARLSAEEFVTSFLLPRRMKALVIGHDFNLGAGREGSAEVLTALGKKYGFDVVKGEPFALDGVPVSSTRLREFIAQGDVKTAASLLGRYHTVSGTVGEGYGRGAGLGFPTANLTEPDALLPGRGVYATFAHISGISYKAVTNIGYNPTFGNTDISFETFLLDANINIYAKPLRLEFVERLRPERKFASPAGLADQISKDIAKARHILASCK